MAVADYSPYKYLGNTAPTGVKNVPKKAVAPAGTKAYNPAAYVPGGSSAAVAGAIQSAGYANPGLNPIFVPQPTVQAPPRTQTTVIPGTAGHWNKTDWMSMIPGDWEVTDAEAQGNRLQGEAEGAFQKALRQAFIDYGGDSSKLGDYAKYIDEPTIQAAQNNKFSQTAQNLAAMTKGLANQRAVLAAKGLGRSGKSTEITRRALEAKEQGDYTAMRSFLSGADEGTAGLATTRQTIADKIAAARSSAAARLAASYPDQWEEGTPEQTITTEVPGGAAAPPSAAAPPAAKPPAGTVNWAGRPMNASQLAAELARTGVNRATWIRNHPGAAQTLGWA